eukprot:9266884-Lingulodinium_polyedra.AAC.1
MFATHDSKISVRLDELEADTRELAERRTAMASHHEALANEINTIKQSLEVAETAAEEIVLS